MKPELKPAVKPAVKPAGRIVPTRTPVPRSQERKLDQEEEGDFLQQLLKSRRQSGVMPSDISVDFSFLLIIHRNIVNLNQNLNLPRLNRNLLLFL